MATGASTADVAILLVDARNGVRTQSRRHARIARLLGITDFVLAVNKMDLMDFDQEVFDKIVDDFDDVLAGASVHAIPMSALHGDNVITTSDRTPYFDGPPLLEYLETVHVQRNTAAAPFRFPVQMVLRPDDVFRGYAGQIVSGTVRTGDRDHRLAIGPVGARQPHRDLRRRPRSGLRADVGHADARRRDRHQPRRRADSRPAARQPALRGRAGVDGRAAARSGPGLHAQAGDAHGDRRSEPPAAAQPDRHRAGVHRAAARVRPLRATIGRPAASS